MNKDYFKNLDPFSLNKKDKIKFFLKEINILNKYHYKHSKEFKKIIDFLNYNLTSKNLEDLPFLPTRLFKEFKLLSVAPKKIFKVLHSSGTSGQAQSQIYLDKENANNQMKVLSKIMLPITGNERLPMLIVDKNPKNNNDKQLSAKSAAINGFSFFGKNHTYLLNNRNEIDYEVLNNFLNIYGDKKFLTFGFTSIVYENLYKKILVDSLNKNFSNAILIHGGGWKKMEKIRINNLEFKKKLNKKLNIKKIYNYYGLVEQTGSIFFECKFCSCFVASAFSEVLVRDKYLKVIKGGKKGFLQLISLLPSSYPGHSILTEDIGEIVEKENCDCSKHGTRFLVHGRSSQSEVRGCSDI